MTDDGATTPPHDPVGSAGGTVLGAIVVSGTATVASIIPTFFLGALAVQLTADLDFGARGLGMTTGAFFATGALSALHLGRLTDRLGATRSLRLAATASMAAMLGIAFTARSWAVLTAWFVLAGAAHSLMQPGSNRLLVGRVPPDRLGMAFGVKQSAPPVASMLAGFSVPLVALTVGWRWAFVIGGAIAFAVVLGAGGRGGGGREKASSSDRRVPLRNRSTIVVLAVAFALGLTANTSVLTFFVVSSVEAGASQQLAGTLFAVGSITAIVTRLVGGVVCDRTALQPLHLAAGLLGFGALGVVLLAVGRPWSMAVGVCVAMIGTWGWPGVFWLALLRAYPDAPGRITGALAPGSIGGIVGPSLFGVIVEAAGYGTAWIAAAVVAALSGATMLAAAGRLVPPDVVSSGTP